MRGKHPDNKKPDVAPACASPILTEDLLLLVADRLEARARAASEVALNLRLAAGMEAQHDARLAELLLKAHMLLVGDPSVASLKLPGLQPQPVEKEEEEEDALPSSKPQSPGDMFGRTPTLTFGAVSSPAPVSSSPPPNESGVRKRKASQSLAAPTSVSTGATEPPQSFNSEALKQWYEKLTKSSG